LSIVDNTFPPETQDVRTRGFQDGRSYLIWILYQGAGTEKGKITENGWFENGEIVWVGDIFPDDVIDIFLMEEDYDESEQISNEEEFESEDDFSDFEN